MSDRTALWEYTCLGNVVSLKTGPFGSALHKEDYVSDEVPLINPIHIRHGRLTPARNVTVTPLTASRLSEYRLNVGDVVMGRRGEMGRCAVVPANAAGWVCGTGSVIVRPSVATYSPYLQRFLSSPTTVTKLEGDSIGTTMVNLNQGILLGLTIPVPPLAEQKRIADKLDAVLARVDTARARLDRVPALIKRFRQTVLAAATRGDLTAEWRSSLPLLEDWREVVVSDIGEVVTGSTPSKNFSQYYGGDICFFKPTELDGGYNVTRSTEGLTAEGAGQARVLPPMSVMVTCIGATIGKTGLSRVTGATNQQINSVVCDLSVAIPEWLYFWFCSPVGQASIIGNASATTLPIINKSRFSNLAVELPSVAEQYEIVRRVESLFAIANKVEVQYNRAIEHLDKLVPALLAKAFRGELVPQDPNDEPAAELLKRLAKERSGERDAKKRTRAIRAAPIALNREQPASVK